MSLNGRLGWALLISLGLHAILLGMGMHSLSIPHIASPTPPMEVAFFDNTHELEQNGRSADRLPVFSEKSATEFGQTPHPPSQASPSPQPSLPAQSPDTPQSTGGLDLTERSLQMARQEATGGLSDQRVIGLSPGTRDTVFASYEEAFSKKVEEVGSLNYPPPVNGQALHGSVRVTTAIKPDGSVAYVDVVHSSGSPALDEAARHIIRMASPYQPFTQYMADRADLVSITRTFNFVQAGDVVGVE